VGKKRVMGDCIFCGHHRQMTKEDIVPIWLGNLLKAIYPDPRGWSTVTGKRVPEGGFERRTARSGGPTEYKLKRVCKECNGGWMRDIENATIPILSPLIRGDALDAITSEQALVIATWMTLKVLTFDLFDRPAIFAPNDCTSFFKEQCPPASFQTWIAGIMDPKVAGQAQAFARWNSYLYPGGGAGGLKPTGRILTLLINEVVIQSVLLCKEVRDTSYFNDRHIPIVAPQIWPFLEDVQWPPGPLLSPWHMPAYATGHPDLGFLTTKIPLPPPPRHKGTPK
jgi:hypothetical protein